MTEIQRQCLYHILRIMSATPWPPSSSHQEPTRFTSDTHSASFHFPVVYYTLYCTVPSLSPMWIKWKGVIYLGLNLSTFWELGWMCTRTSGKQQKEEIITIYHPFSMLFTPQINSGPRSESGVCRQKRHILVGTSSLPGETVNNSSLMGGYG